MNNLVQHGHFESPECFFVYEAGYYKRLCRNFS